MRRIVFAGILSWLAFDASAFSGEEIYQYCGSNACGGYFIGAFDTLRILGAIGTGSQRAAASICPPEAVADEQVIDVALEYLQRHPESRHLLAANLTLRAWRERWPCPH